MRFSSNLVLACSSIALSTCGLSGTAFSATAPSSGGAAVLPSITVEAPSQTPRHRHPTQRATVRVTAPHRTSPTSEPSLTTTLAAPTSVMAKLASLERISGSCVDGCQTSFRTGNAPWRGCSSSGWPALSSTCRNIYHFKTYAECTGTGMLLGWQSRELTWYCTSLALK